MLRPSFSLVPWLLASWAAAASAAEIKLITKRHDPYGSPRPAPKQEHVPLRTSFWIELGLSEKDAKDAVLPDSVGIELSADGVPPIALLKPGRLFAAGYTGKFIPGNDKNGPKLSIYVDGTEPLRPMTLYSIRVQAQSKTGATLAEQTGTWQFTTEAAPTTHRLTLTVPDAPTVHWHGGFFTGTCNVTFANSYANRIPTFELMAEVRKRAPKAWSLGRDFWLTGMEQKPSFFGSTLPNIVRERETRHITAIDNEPQGTVLHVEDFFGHEQYGIPSNRALSEDYHTGDEILINDGSHDTRTKVLAADDEKRTVLVTRVEPPKEGWKLAYSGSLPTKENPNAPGRFAPGGCYLLKFKPRGTPVYFWKRLDHEWDLQVKRFQRRVFPNFADAPGDLSINGRDWTTAKDYAELHEVTRTIAGHIIDRYGDASLTFPWSVFNEPDLGILFWRSDWNELQKFYDYTVDGILRAFEDRGYDSNKVFIGGLELGAVFGTNLKVKEFLSHCSPREQKLPGTLAKNAAFADARLDGKRSRRVEALCQANAGRGSPCDFISIHAYNGAKMMADKIIRAKEIALEIDSDYYAKLWVNSHEACPDWQLPPDPAFGDSYLGNGYFPTWSADVIGRLLRQAAKDPRYAYGESILTTWPGPPQNFAGANDTTRAIRVDDNGDGVADRTVTVAMPILHFLGLVAEMGSDFRVLPEQKVGGHVVSGFVSQTGKTHRVLLYTHNLLDTESRSDAEFEIALELPGVGEGPVQMREYRFDKDHNSYFRVGRKLREEEASRAKGSGPKAYPAAVVREVEELSKLHETGRSSPKAAADGKLTLTARVAANGATYLVVEPMER